MAPGEHLKPGTIRDSNSFVIGALARSWDADVRLIGIARDTVADLTGRLAEAGDVDLIVTSGGVSLGDYDLVKDVLKSEGEIAIWQVRMKPGKPLAFGHIGLTPLLGLPGNPVAAAVSFVIFGRPAIRKMLGHAVTEPRMVEVVTADGIDNRGHRRHYVRVRLEPAEGAPATCEDRGRARSWCPQLAGRGRRTDDRAGGDRARAARNLLAGDSARLVAPLVRTGSGKAARLFGAVADVQSREESLDAQSERKRGAKIRRSRLDADHAGRAT